MKRIRKLTKNFVLMLCHNLNCTMYHLNTTLKLFICKIYFITLVKVPCTSCGVSTSSTRCKYMTSRYQAPNTRNASALFDYHDGDEYNYENEFNESTSKPPQAASKLINR